MSFITAAAHPELFDKNIREVTERAEKEMWEKYNTLEMLYGIKGTDRAYEKFASVTDSPDIVPWDGKVEYLPRYNGYDYTVQPKIHGGGTQYERELFDTKQFSVMDDRAANLARSTARYIDKVAIEPLSLAFSATNGSFMTSEEGVALCGSHGNKTGYPTTLGFTNYGTAALTPANVQAAIIAYNYLRSDIGERIYPEADCIFYPTNLKFRVEEIFGTEKGLDNAEGNLNVLGPRGSANMKRMEIPRLGDSSTTNWFIGNYAEMKKMLLWMWLVKPEYDSTVDFETKSFKTSVYTQFGWLFRGWRWVYGSMVS